MTSKPSKKHHEDFTEEGPLSANNLDQKIIHRITNTSGNNLAKTEITHIRIQNLSLFVKLSMFVVRIMMVSCSEVPSQ